MSLALNVGNWWESSRDKLWMMNLKQSNLLPKVSNLITTVETKLNIGSMIGLME